jgi:hypothetical protein
VKSSIQQTAVFAILLGAGLIVGSGAQDKFDSISAEESDNLLVHIQRVKDGEFSCLLLRQDNRFHLEYLKNQKADADIREGVLPEAASQELKALLAGEKLAALSQQGIREPLLSTEGRYELALNIHRVKGPEGWQNLHFRTRESLGDVNAEVAPVLKWFDSLRRAPYQTLSEEVGRNNCRLGQRELKVRSPTGDLLVAPSGALSREVPAYLFRATTLQFGGDGPQRHCAIVYPNGKYHVEIAKQRFREPMNLVVFDDTLLDAEIAVLNHLLDDPELVASQHRNTSTDLSILSGELTSVQITRAGGIQDLMFSRFVGRSSGKSDSASDTRVIQPLLDWLKKGLEKRSARANPHGVLNQCQSAP